MILYVKMYFALIRADLVYINYVNSVYLHVVNLLASIYNCFLNCISFLNAVIHLISFNYFQLYIQTCRPSLLLPNRIVSQL